MISIINYLVHPLHFPHLQEVGVILHNMSVIDFCIKMSDLLIYNSTGIKCLIKRKIKPIYILVQQYNTKYVLCIQIYILNTIYLHINIVYY